MTDGTVTSTLKSLSGRLQAAFPDLPPQVVARSVHEAFRAATLIGMDTIETVDRLAREQLRSQVRRMQALGPALRRRGAVPLARGQAPPR
jgi:hypothetical protein